MAKYRPNISRLYPQRQTPRPSVYDLVNQQRRTGPSGVSSSDAAVQAVLDRGTAQGYTLPTQSTVDALDALVTSLKSDGIWAKLDLFYVFATDGDKDFAKINFIAPSSFECTENGTLTWTSLEGFTGNGSTGYLNTQFTPSTDGVNYTQDSASFGFYARTTSTVNSDEMGCVNTVSGNAATITARLTNNFAQFDINSNSGLTGATTDGLGFYHAERYNSSNMRLYKNGATLRASAITSTGLPDQEMYILAKNSNGSSADESDAQISIAFVGASLLSEASSFSTLIETYMDAIGKGVVA